MTVDAVMNAGCAGIRELATAATSYLGGDADALTGFVVLGSIAMVYMAWGIGANDCANNFATTWSSGALSLWGCVGVAAVCEFSGAVLLGSSVTKTFRKGMVNTSAYDGEDGRILVLVGMTAVLISAATWLLVASRYGLPVSTTHSAVGGVIAFGVITKGYDAVKWDKCGMIVASWFISPVLSLIMGYCVRVILNRFVLQYETEKAYEISVKVVPLISGLSAFVIALFIFYKGAKGVGLNETDIGVAIGISFGIAAVIAAASKPIAMLVKKRLDDLNQEAANEELANRTEFAANKCEKGDVDNKKPIVDVGTDVVDDRVVQVAGVPPPLTTGIVAISEDAAAPPKIQKKLSAREESELMQKKVAAGLNKNERFWCGFCWLTASFQALAHGGNDVANSVGPFAAVLAASEGNLSAKSEVPVWVFVVAGLGICLGMATFGHHVMRTMGQEVCDMVPSKAFSVQISATTVILIATRAGLPISTTHASVGAIMGTGIADAGLKEGLNWKTLAKVFSSWIITLPIVGITASGIYGFMLPMAISQPVPNFVAAP